MKNNQINIPSLDILFEDLNHPNPNINYSAALKMNQYWPEESMKKLINNFSNPDVQLRRKSVKALGIFGEKALLPVSKLFSKSKDSVIRVSCLKVLVLLASSINLETYPPEVNNVIKLALEDNSPEISLALVSFLRQSGEFGIPFLKIICRDANILKARASITAISEIQEPSIEIFLMGLIEDKSLDIMTRQAAGDCLNISLENYKIHQ